MEQGSNKSLFVLLSVIIFGIFLSLTYWFFDGDYKLILQDIFKNTNDKVEQITLGTTTEGTTNGSIFEYKNDEDTSPNDTYYDIPTITVYKYNFNEFGTDVIVDYSTSYGRIPLRTEVFMDYYYDPEDTEFNNLITVIEKNHIIAEADYKTIDSTYFGLDLAELLDPLVITDLDGISSYKVTKRYPFIKDETTHDYINYTEEYTLGEGVTSIEIPFEIYKPVYDLDDKTPSTSITGVWNTIIEVTDSTGYTEIIDIRLSYVVH